MNERPSSSRGVSTDIALAVLAALILRLGYLLALRRAIDMADAIHYIAMAKGFAAGDFLGFDENLPVLYSLCGAFSHIFIRNWEHAFWAVSIVSSSLLVVPVYLLSRELHGRASARIAGALVCFWPWLVDYGSRVAPEALAVTLWFTSVWLLYRGVERGRGALGLAPIAFFLLHLTRPEGTFIMIAAPFCGLVLCVRRTRTETTRLALFTAGCTILLAAYAIAMRLLIGTATVSYRAPMPGDLLDYFRRGAFEMARTAMALAYEVLPVMLGPLLLVFLGIGLFWPSDRARKYRLEALILLFCAAQWALTLANFSPEPRYIMTVVVALSLWSAHGLKVITRRAAATGLGRGLRLAPVGLVVLAMVVGLAANLLSEPLGRMPRTPREYRIAGQWMREHLEPGYVICRKPQVGFYAEMPSVGPDAGDDPQSVVAFAKEIGARYLVVDERHSTMIVPGLEPLLDPRNAPVELVPLTADVSPYPGARVVIYQIVAPGIRYLRPEEFPAMTSHMGPDERRRKVAPDD